MASDMGVVFDHPVLLFLLRIYQKVSAKAIRETRTVLAVRVRFLVVQIFVKVGVGVIKIL